MGPLILFAGESNNGHLNTGPAPYEPTARVQIWVDSDGDGLKDAFHYMRPGFNTGLPNQPDAWGPEVEFANAWLAANPGTEILWIGKEVKGSTTLADDWSDGQAMFERAELTANRMLANLGRDHLDAVLFTQGVNDAFDFAKAGAYEDRLTVFAEDVRDQWMHDPNGQIVLARVVASVPFGGIVAAAQVAVDANDVHLQSFSMDGFEFRDDGFHLSAVGYVELGRSMFDGWSQ